jgi:hypothetical protein
MAEHAETLVIQKETMHVSCFEMNFCLIIRLAASERSIDFDVPSSTAICTSDTLKRTNAWLQNCEESSLQI